ncbi:MAG TPA: hypothetical protein VFL65_10360 [Jatrophihabitans sp.]|nr:hypothetical protein [Jatrophihabitans sp.]
MTVTRPARAAAVLALLASLAACGSSGSRPPAAIETGTQQILRHDLATLVDKAAAHDTGAALTAAAHLDADATTAHTAGRLSDERFAQIESAIARVEADLTAPKPTPTRTVQVTVPPRPPAPSPPEHKHGKGHGGDGNDQ